MKNPSSLKFDFGSVFPKLANGASPDSIVIGDINRDGKPDLLTSNGAPGTASIYLGAGAGVFPASPTTTIGVSVNNPKIIALGDFSNDGNLDLVSANQKTPGGISIKLGDGNGGFGAASDIALGNDTRGLIVTDLNGDKRLDIVASNIASDNVSVLLGNGNGTFSTPTSFSTGTATNPVAIATADVNGDGKKDLVTANKTSNNISVLLGDGRGNFGAPTSFATGTLPYGVVIADFNGDGKADVATANFKSDTISVLLGNGDGTFAAATSITVDDGPVAIVAADFNGDGLADLAVANQNAGTVSLLVGNGNGTFAAPLSKFVGNTPYALTAGDIDGDGKVDLATVNGGAKDISLLLNQTTLVVIDAPTIDGSREKTFSINADLTTATLNINSDPLVTTNVAGTRNVIGTQVGDTLYGDVQDNRFDGQSGDDFLNGRGGDDQLVGGAGADRIFGKGGDDQLTGSEGDDLLRGGLGSDEFVFDMGKTFDGSTLGVDKLMGFKPGRDVIVLDDDTFTKLDKRVSFEVVQSVAEAERSAALIVYVQAGRSLYYNPNEAGAGFGTGGLFATFGKQVNLTEADFEVRR